MKIKQITFTAYKTLIINNITLLKITFGEISLLLGIEGVSKCAPSFFMHKAPTFTSRGFVIT